MNDLDPLIEPASATRVWRRKTTFFCLGLVLLGLLGLGLALGLSYSLNGGKVPLPGVSLKVMALNTWGIPATFGSHDKTLRMRGIGNVIQKQEYDIYLLEELWMKADHELIRKMIPENFSMTSVEDFNNPNQETLCDGVVAPDGCSGLAIVSRYSLLEVEFLPYTDHGNILHFDDGEFLARKGAGRVRIEPGPNVTLDVFVTHTCASDYNYWYRQRQVKELVKFVKKSTADFVVLGGDFNVDPKAKETTFHDVKEIMINSIEEFFKNIEEWLIPRRATYANPQNTYSSQYKPILYDYIFHKAMGNGIILTNFFEIPFLKTSKTSSVLRVNGTENSNEVSLSDHEAVTARLILWK